MSSGLPTSENTFVTLKKSIMSAIVILLIASISVAALFLAAFIWSVRSGQYDDEFSPPQRILFDPPTETPKESK
jgi:cbb3-type cytochrome oxidase maturation protein